MKSIFLSCLILFCYQNPYCQNDDDAFFIKKIYSNSLAKAKAYKWLFHLSENIGGRLAGSENAEHAILYTKDILHSLNLDTVRLQECEVPVWNRGNTELVAIVNSPSTGTTILNATSLGNSVGSGSPGIWTQLE